MLVVRDGASVDTIVTPRPVYHADGRKSADCYTRPAALHDRLTTELGTFPLFSYWGPTAGIASSRWIVEAARRVLSDHDMTLVYLPHLDYDLQRHGPAAPQARAAAADLDAVLEPLLADAARAGTTVVALSEYGITEVSQPVHINRALREAGLLEIHHQAGRELLDPMASRAFAVADHQVAHVYVRERADLPRTRAVLAEVPGIEQLLGRDGLRAHSLDHPRSETCSQWRRRTPSSPGTTGSTTAGHPISLVVWRSSARPAMTRPSCSSTRMTAGCGAGPRSACSGRGWACATR